MPRKAAIQNISPKRFFTLLGIAISIVFLLVWRLGQLHISQKSFLQDQGSNRSVRAVTEHAPRGIIFDRNGEPLAVSSPVKSVWLNPKQWQGSQKDIQKLAKLLGTSPLKLAAKINKSQKDQRQFLYLKRHISPSSGSKIEKLNLTGVSLITEYRRYYPQGEMAAHLLGTTNIDQKGIQGLELSLNDWLTGQPGKTIMLKDRFGNKMEILGEKRSAKNGHDVHLSLDSSIQYQAFKELMKAVKQHGAKSGSLIALDVTTGEVLSMVNYPSYNPNKRFAVIDARFRNRAVTDTFEPGSTIKPFTMVNLISSGQYNPNSFVDTNPGYLKVSGHLVKDVRNYGIIDLNSIIKKSSNVGISKLSLELPVGNLYDTFTDFGFGKITHSGFPGELKGFLKHRYQLKPIEHAALSYGYGLSVTPLQLVRAYATLASNCKQRKIRFIKRNTIAAQQNYVISRQVCEPAVAKAVNKMLQLAVAPGGTGTRAAVPGYQVAGKTGTIRKISDSGYQDDNHVSMFAGFAPADAPKVAMVVVIDGPTVGQYYGGDVAAPVFSKVMYTALKRLKIPAKQMKPKMVLAKR